VAVLAKPHALGLVQSGLSDQAAALQRDVVDFVEKLRA
jgi:hypothetical protein